MNTPKVKPKINHEADRQEWAVPWITEFERVFVAGSAAIRGEETAIGRRRKHRRFSSMPRT